MPTDRFQAISDNGEISDYATINPSDVLLIAYWHLHIYHYYYYYFTFMAAPVAYRSSQARGRVRAAAASLCHSHSNSRSGPRLLPTQQAIATQDP